MLNWMLNDSQVAFGSSGIIALCRSHTRRCPLSALICLPSGKGVRSRESLSPMVTQWSQLGSPWDELCDVASRTSDGWLVAGDFNEIISADEKRGAPFNPSRNMLLAEVLQDCHLVDIGNLGPCFAWRAPRVGPYTRTFEPLDRTVANPAWRISFPDACV